MELKLPLARPPPSRVAETNDDAQISKLSCVNLGYFKDDYVHYFVRAPQRRAPLINRGYFARHEALVELAGRFAACLQGASFQVLSLGAGYDTLFWQLEEAGGFNISRYIEVDVAPVCTHKAGIIRRTPRLARLVGPEEAGAEGDDARGGLRCARYALAAADLRDLGQLAAATAGAGLDPGVPTLVLAECVLVYLEPAQSAAVLDWAASQLHTAALAVYEQIKPDDAFGRQMLLNLEARGCPLLAICRDLREQAARLLQAGWQRAEAEDMGVIYRKLDLAALRRIQRLEIFDEFEEWDLIQSHYCIALGIKDEQGALAGLRLLPR